MKKILGLDLGTNSIGWAVVNEAEKEGEKSSIVKLGVRTISFDNFVNAADGQAIKGDPILYFNGGKSISSSAARTKSRSARRNLQRYKLRREYLKKLLKENRFIDDEAILAEHGNASTFETYRLRAKAATDEVSLSEFARILLMINKKRGYKSSRKAKNKEDGKLIDGMAIAKKLYDENLTPGQFVNSLYAEGKRFEPDFYRSDLQAEFDKIWNFQKNFYPEILTDSLRAELKGKNKNQTWAICKTPFSLVGSKRTTKGFEQKKEDYAWRVQALSQKMDLESLAIVLQNINGQIDSSSGYLGAIGDRSKELSFNNLTVGQYQMAELEKNPHYSLKNQVFYRQDYMDEFDKLWSKQSEFHKELTPELKRRIRDVVIFYQRPLKSQKNLISICELESVEKTFRVDGATKVKKIGPRVAPKSSPIYQEFRIWQNLNNLIVVNKEDGEFDSLKQEEKEKLFAELNLKGSLSKADALKVLFGKSYRNYDLNLDKLDGNTTQQKLFEAYRNILEMNGDGEFAFAKFSAKEVLELVQKNFKKHGFKTDFLTFDTSLDGKDFEIQPLYKLWHLLYSFEGDKTPTGDGKLIEKLQELCGMDFQSAATLSAVTFEEDYGSLSVKALKKILPFMKQGKMYSEACELAGYKHSKRSLTKEELAKKIYKDHLELLPMHCLHNPVVEKILNQMVNVVNAVVDGYGKPDEIRIELARELKKSAKERQDMADAIKENTAKYEEYRTILQRDFGIEHPSRNDLLRYRLYKELDANGGHTLYSGTYISPEKLFSKEFDIEHIIPQARRFDDSFANKTLEARQVNLEKSDSTAFDYVMSKYGEEQAEQYKIRIDKLFSEGAISKTKYKNLLMREEDIPTGFIERDLRDTQYIAKKAREMLEDLVPFVVATTGSVTDRLREDWQLVDVMQELNWNKYDKLGLTESWKDKDGRTIRRIKDWTKRNDHRHHAMDALTIAFTKRSYIQYLNNLNARTPKGVEDVVDLSKYDLSQVNPADVKRIEASIEAKELYRDKQGKLRFYPPIPLDEFRAEAKQQLESTLISIKARNKVVTLNTNVSKGKDGKLNKQRTLTPRGQLHNESIYGSFQNEVVKNEKVDAKLTAEKIATVCNFKYRNVLLERLNAFDGDPKKAFTGKNSLEKNPIYLDELHTKQVPSLVKTKTYETVYTIRKAVAPDLNVDKVIDKKVQKVLNDRLTEFGNDPKQAFVNLKDNPIWLNKEKGISVTHVTIRGVSNAVSLRNNRDFVNTANNHHVAIFQDAKGDLQEHIISFLEATQRAVKGLPVVDKEFNQNLGWRFLFTMKQNEFFVFPHESTGFDPKQIDFLDPQNYAQISPNLFRVQKFSTKDYCFRHHLESTLGDVKSLQDITWKRIRNANGLRNCVKVRVNHIGQIVSVGEY